LTCSHGRHRRIEVTIALQPHLPQITLLIGQCVVVCGMVLVLFRLRPWFGITLMCVLVAVLQPVASLLSSGFFLEVATGIVITPGSAVLFNAGLFAVLLVYLREDSVAVRTVMYSLVVANALVSLMILALKWQQPLTIIDLDQIGTLVNQQPRYLAGGTFMFAVDVFLIIPIYEWLGRHLPKADFWRIYLTLGIIFTLDTAGFAAIAFYGDPLFADLFLSGITGKLSAGFVFTALLVAYLRYIEPERLVLNPGSPQKLGDVFDTLSYRQRYELQRAVAEEALGQVTGLQRDLLNAASDALIALDADACVVDANSAAEVLLETPRETLLGQHVSKLISLSHSELRAELAAYAKQQKGQQADAWVNGFQRSLDVSCTTKEGERHHLIAWLTPITPTHGPIRTLIALRDVSEQKQKFEQQLHASRMESLGRLAGGVAHDFNNLLMVIVNAATFLEDGQSENNTYARMIREAAERGGRLTRQLLAFARSESLAPTIVDLNALLQELRGLLVHVVGDDVEIVMALGEDVPRVWVSRDQLEQVIMNLASNARDVTPIGGTITFTTARCELLGDEPGASPGVFASIKVTDYGPGISPEHLNHIFDPFFTTKEVGEGTGLGLAMSLGVVQQHGGTLRVESELGEGSTFDVLLPQTHRNASQAKPAKPIAPDMIDHNKLVLVVDDDANVAEVVSQILISHGYSVAVVHSAQQALQIFASGARKPDLLISDVVMPDMRGDEMVRQLQRRGVEVPVIYMTGHATGFSVDMPSFGDHPLLHKPFQSVELLSAVGRALSSAPVVH
jgi:PAS domain S-box-containing protein